MSQSVYQCLDCGHVDVGEVAECSSCESDDVTAVDPGAYLEKLAYEIHTAETCIYSAHRALLRERMDLLPENATFAPNIRGANLPYVKVRQTDEDELEDFVGEKYGELAYLNSEAESLGVERR